MHAPDRFTVDAVRGVGADGPVVVERAGDVLRVAAGRPAGSPHLAGTLLHGVVDHHVHLGLVAGERLAGSPVVAVQDLGWIPEAARGWRDRPHTGGTIRIAGPIITAVGGYPLGRPWAPDAMVRQVGDPAEVRAAVEEARRHRHDLVKVALHGGQGRLDDRTLAALVHDAHAAGLEVGVHAEGPGQAERALAAGADLLVHAPWSERLRPDVLIAMAERMTWISTLAIHAGTARRRAMQNAVAFAAAGGRLRYGTDLGNGPTPVGLNGAEVALLARVAATPGALVEMLVGPPVIALPVAGAVLATGPEPVRRRDVDRWLRSAVRLTRAGPGARRTRMGAWPMPTTSRTARPPSTSRTRSGTSAHGSWCRRSRTWSPISTATPSAGR